MLSTLSVGCQRTLLARPSYNCKMLMIHKAFNLVLTFSIICGGIRTRTETPLSTAITGSFQDYCLNTIRLIPPFDITRTATFESPSLMVSYAFTILMFFPQFITLRYICAEGETRTHTPFLGPAPQAGVSTIPPLPHCAERQGFEPWDRSSRSMVFKTTAIDHSATSP